MDDETITNKTDETEDTEDLVDTEPTEEEPVSYTAEEMYLLATQNQEDFSPYYRAIYAAAESGGVWYYIRFRQYRAVQRPEIQRVQRYLRCVGRQL